MWRIRKRKKFRTNLGEVTFTAPPFSVHLRSIYLEICVYIGCHSDFSRSEITVGRLPGCYWFCLHQALRLHMLVESLKSVYLNRLLEPSVPLRLKVQVLNNIETYLQEEEIRMIKEDQQWSMTSKKENLKEMGDVTSGMEDRRGPEVALVSAPIWAT
ncbi:hypothetical protein DAPPUDRAFT_114730 [Daphnia pulex]|uniref:Uncharacterized protein n=1 Tax=Daphnia pulex TaxID=6669 RepID=E9HJ28_DAPPU|nr:hypothetical protein DAPPUDRAFT_114730 [Daphnia pulex]|eukprot:EFX68268.1 hypothetical protein DAPPUDRAFT_114730 [Daphnia pulex]